MDRRSICFRLVSLVSGSSFGLGLLLWAGAAHAHDYHDREYRRHEPGRLMLALDMDYSAALAHSEIDQGGGAGIRVGLERDYFLVTLIPEVQLNYHRLNANTRDDAAISSAKAGGRVRFLKIVEPGIFAHAGLANVAGDSVYAHTGIAFDAGLTLDLTLLPLVDIGLHTAWNRIFGDDDSGVSYVTAGAHVALVL